MTSIASSSAPVQELPPPWRTAGSTFFWQQTSRKSAKRFRKSPDELPQSLRFANFNPRLAAFLTKQDKQKKAEADTEGGTHEETEEGGKKKESLLPAINQTLSLIQESLDRATSNLQQLEQQEQENKLAWDDPQKIQFEESKYAAPTLLVELAKVLYLFEHEETVNLHTDIVWQLCWGFKELCLDVVFTKREWQSNAYRGTSATKKHSEGTIDHTQMDESKSSTSRMDADRETSRDEEGSERRRRRRAGTRSDVISEESVDSPRDDDQDDSRSRVGFAQIKEGRVLSGGGRSRTRAERFKLPGITGLPADSGADRKVSLMSSRASGLFYDTRSQASDVSTALPYSSAHTPAGYMSVLNFSLANKACEEKGWIVHPNERDDPERQTMLEWARQRLLLSIKISTEQHEKALELGHDKPLVIRFYGDTKREAMLKYKKQPPPSQKPGARVMSPPKIPRMDSPVEQGRLKLMRQLPDGSCSVFYPSGRVAISISPPTKPSQLGLYTNVYADNLQGTMLASFTPSGHGCCYHPNGVPRFVMSPEGGTLMEPDGTISKQWSWPKIGKLPVTVNVQVTELLVLRCTNLSSVVLHFACQKETAKFNVGLHAGAVQPKVEEMGYLKTEGPFISQAAKESVKPKKKEKDRLRRGFVKPKEKRVSQQMAELTKILELPGDKDEFFSQAEKDLVRLQRKVKNLIDDWMEHYRIAMHIRSPHLATLSHRPGKQSARRTVQSARPAVKTPLISLFHQIPKEEDGEEGERVEERNPPTKHQSFRSPSAPPRHMIQERPLTAASSRPFSSADGLSRKGETDSKVRLDLGSAKEGEPKSQAGSAKTRQQSTSSAGSPMRAPSSLFPKSASHANLSTPERVRTPLREGCPVSLRAEILGEGIFACKCSKHKVPLVLDLEFDRLLKEFLPKNQLIIIAVTSTYYTNANPCDTMLERMYIDRNKNRTMPCVQSRSDPFRIFKYDMAVAAELTDYDQPLLLRRHNAVAGMFLMYYSGKLLFCDHIFNGYGNAKKDLVKQILKTKHDAKLGNFLPADFRFCPSRGKHGPRAAWGGEIGGTGIGKTGKPGLPRDARSDRTPSVSSIDSREFFVDTNRWSQGTARDVVTLSLSKDYYFLREEQLRTANPSTPKLQPVPSVGAGL
ncbi:C3orf20 [Branchiostoma lanceolatum]|uniref:C3orf20 protein n=1 Tax=Branchiostoma lanceolatum TaxID=7740 RepID=A0A8K0ET87_BRALA|nr:C3orf20 [Branchiostoma lanceolatum]